MKKTILFVLVLVVGVLACFFGLPVASWAKRNVVSSPYVFGVDISHYNGKTRWEKVGTSHPVEFVIVRATMGDDRLDTRYKANVDGARARGLVVGHYHYYDPDENSTLQAENFCRTVDFRKGDFRPVLDIEEPSRVQNQSQLNMGLKNWCAIVEARLGAKPIIYAGLRYYEANLADAFPHEEHDLWIAAYGEHFRKPVLGFAEMFQFTDRARVRGFATLVDGNDVPREHFARLIHK